ncbi:PTS 3-keto-L-gulonate transporter subunit IIA [Deltaproteobacteria bacterium]|nr:PTS 3-keto-L-gulonate transporter subunit IIA [Deltaproteobacteria bacterium]
MPFLCEIPYTPAMRYIPWSVYLRIFLRTYLVGAAFTLRGLQNVGFIYALEPGLSAIHTQPASLRQARSRYVRHHNCHTFWTPLIAGMFLHAEDAIAANRMTVESFMGIKDTATYTFSALGDSVIGGSMLVSWALLTTLLLITGNIPAAAGFTLALLILLQLCRLFLFAFGLRYGLKALFQIRRFNLINWGDYFKIGNAALLLLIFIHCAPQNRHPLEWVSFIGCAVLAAWLVARLHVPRTVLAWLAVMVLCFIA